MKEWDGYWRILKWNRLTDSDFDETPEMVYQCRIAWKQISTIVQFNSRLPKEFLYPFRGYRRNDPIAIALYDDERRIILCMSDLRDYLQLMRLKARRLEQGNG